MPMPRRYMHVYDHHFQRFSSLKPLGELKPNLACSIRDASSDDNQADIIEAFNSTSRYLDDLHKIDNPFFVGMVNQIYPPELQLNKVNTLGIDASLFWIYIWAVTRENVPSDKIITISETRLIR